MGDALLEDFRGKDFVEKMPFTTKGLKQALCRI